MVRMKRKSGICLVRDRVRQAFGVNDVRISWVYNTNISCLICWAVSLLVLTHTQHRCSAVTAQATHLQMTNSGILFHEHETLWNLFQLVEWHRFWGSILILMYWPTVRGLKNKNMHVGEGCKQLSVSSINPAYEWSNASAIYTIGVEHSEGTVTHHHMWMVSHGMVCLGPKWSGQRTSVKCAEAAWNYKVRGHSVLKVTCIFFVFCFCFMWLSNMVAADKVLHGRHKETDPPFLVPRFVHENLKPWTNESLFKNWNRSVPIHVVCSVSNMLKSDLHILIVSASCGVN